MKIGLLMAFTEESPNPASFARAAEDLGFESLWVPEHPVLPVNPKTSFPQGGEIPSFYAHMGDQFVALAMAAAATTKLRLATGVCLVPEHEPIITAKQVATLDACSGGRVIFGIGAGWLREESELLHVDFPRRWTQTAEYIAAMRELWSKPEASFEGKYVKFSPVRCYPKPVQKPGPPVLIGGIDKNVFKRIAKWGDGWCPIRATPDFVREKLAELRAECKAVGRDFAKLDITAMAVIAGERAQVQQELKSFAEAGVNRFVISSAPLALRDYQASLEHYASLYV